MTIDRRMFLAGATGLVTWPALADAQDASARPEVYERETGGRIGLYAENLSTGAKLVWRADERFVMCSSFKASLAAFVLSQVDRGLDDLDDMISYGRSDLLDYAPVARQHRGEGTDKATISVAEMCKGAVELSDNTFANLLLARVGGPASLTAFWRATGDAVTRLDHNEPALNYSPPGDPNDTTTPAAMAGNLRRFLLGDVLSAGSREKLTGWMLDCKTGDNRLRGGLPGNWKIADKTGNNGHDATGDIAVAWPGSGGPVLICVYVQGGSPTPPQLQAVFADIGRMVGHRLA
jgi:beta-lactamase class A